MTLDIFIPYAPSVNSHWHSGRGRVYLSGEARRFRKAVHECLLERYGVRYPRFGNQAVAVSIVLYPPDKRRRDIDAPIKETLDALASAGVFDDDYQVTALSIVRRPPEGDPGMQVLVKLWEAP